MDHGTSDVSHMPLYDNENPLVNEHKFSISQSPDRQGPPMFEDPDVESFDESASMIAFALSTPTKDDPLNFHNKLNK